MPHLAVEEGRLWYETRGGGAGLPLVLVHGGPGASHRQLEGLAARLPDRPLVLFDQLGCGASDAGRLEDWRLDAFVGHLAALVRHLGLERYHLFGHSWGGMLALAFAGSGLAPAPARLVLSGPLLDARRWEADARALLDALPPGPDRAARFYDEHWCRDAQARVHLRSGGRFNREQYARMWGQDEWDVTGTLRDADVTPMLEALDVPTLVTCGAHDVARPAALREHAARMPRAQVLEFASSAHVPFEEEPEAYARAVDGFLRGHDAG